MKWLGETLQNAKEATPTGCPFGTVIYIYREDGTIGTIEPAEDGCKIYRSGEKYYELNVDSTEVFNAFGIEPRFDKAETTTEGDNRIVTVRHYSWFREDGKPTVAVFDKYGNMISRETQIVKEKYEYENGICVGWKEFEADVNGVYASTHSRTFTYVYDGKSGLLSTIREDENGNRDEIAFNGSSEQEEVLRAVDVFIDNLSESEKDTIVNRETPYIARVAPPFIERIALAEEYEVNENTLTRLAYKIVFETEGKIPGPITVYVD